MVNSQEVFSGIKTVFISQLPTATYYAVTVDPSLESASIIGITSLLASTIVGEVVRRNLERKMKKIREYTARLEAEKTPMSYATEFSFLLNPDDQENIRRLPHRHGDEFVFRARSMASYMRQEGLVRHESDFDFTEPLGSYFYMAIRKYRHTVQLVCGLGEGKDQYLHTFRLLETGSEKIVNTGE